MKWRFIYISVHVLFVAGLTYSCSNNYVPKPAGYLRFDPPPASYALVDLKELPYRFMISRQAAVEMPPTDSIESWINIDYQIFNAKIYCSYLSITPQSLPEHTDGCRRLVSRTVKRASAISEKAYENDAEKVYAMLFDVEGETASPVQFMLTDSVSHFFRGALYFQCEPNADSLAPYIEYLRNDVIELIQSFEWK